MVGAVATVRNRRGVIAKVDPFDGDIGRLHAVHLEYKDDQLPQSETLIWEREPHRYLLEPTALPRVSDTDPMPTEDFDALLRATRWSATAPYLDPDGEGPIDRLPLSSPFHGAIQVEDYQLVPLLKALRMPRVNLLIADDVGLGKTIEAGLILSELLIRRRIQRVLILTPAALRLQWQRDELWDKFSLHFDLVDRAETYKLRKRLGMDANPWRSYNRIIASYHYLRQDDIREQFLAACKTPEGSPRLPWDLLIVDECHNLMPSPFGDDSDLCQMLRDLAPQFEHRLFLSATPHNGHTRCFTGLLEILDPVRFSQTSEINDAQRNRIQQVVIRRLKREINAHTDPPKFCKRMDPQMLPLRLSHEEAALSAAFSAFRKDMRSLIAKGTRQRSGSFAIEVLGKRLLSCPVSFAESWRRCKEGFAEEKPVADNEVAAAERSLRQETADDREAQSREATASTLVGGWLKSFSTDLAQQIGAIDRAVTDLGLDISGEIELVDQNPRADARFDALCELVDRRLRKENNWRDDERLVVFTEYKTTLDYVVRRFHEKYGNEQVLTLFGGGEMDENEREDIKDAFNDRAHGVRVLIATDAAAEGLNLQHTARYMLHYDCPWNPSKLEQRNGRLDRHGQARDVTIHHFISDQDQDLQFLAHVIRKADEIREDLGSANELFDEAAHRRLVRGESLDNVQRDLERGVKLVRGRVTIDADSTMKADEMKGDAGIRDLGNVANEIDLDPPAMRDTLESAMAIRAGRPQLNCSDRDHTCKIVNPGLPGWSEVIDHSLRIRTETSTRGPVARMAFSVDPFLKNIGGRQVFLPRPDTRLMHLSHPMLQRGLSSLTRCRFPGTADGVSCWTVTVGNIPEEADAIVLLSLEEIAVNDLRETYHHWVRTICFPIKSNTLGKPLSHLPAINLRGIQPAQSKQMRQRAQEIFDDVESKLKDFLRHRITLLTKDLQTQLNKDGETIKREEDRLYRSRQGEMSSLIAGNTVHKFEREIKSLKKRRQEGLLFDAEDHIERIDREISEKEKEIVRRMQHYEEIREQLEKERERILKRVLPNRFTMTGMAQVFPVTVEVRLPGVAP